jgi:hypothetical protein
VSLIAQLIAEISGPCSTCGGTGHVPTAPVPARIERRQVTERGIAIIGEPALVEIPAKPRPPSTCPACYGGGRQMSAAGHELRDALAGLLRDNFAAYDHGHEIL